MNDTKIGKRINKYMVNKGLTLEEMARQTSLDRQFLQSLIDDDIYPSLGPLLKISRALGLRLGTLLDDQMGQDPLIVRKESRTQELVTHKGANNPADLTFHSLGKGKADRHMEPFFIEVFPESADSKIPSSHEGEEFIMVTSGEIEIFYGNKTYILSKGDSIYYNSIVPHYVCCHGDMISTIVAVVYIP